MAISTSDFFVAERGGVPYKLTGQEFLNFFKSNFGTTDYRVADIAARNALSDLSVGDIVLVDDATSDASVDVGWAMYRNLGAGTWTKFAEEESTDIIITSDLSTTTSVNTVTINNAGGTDATIAAASNTAAGVMSATDFVKLGFITVTGAVDLDSIATNSHVAATTAGATPTNPINVDANQVFSFSIAQLASLPA